MKSASESRIWTQFFATAFLLILMTGTSQAGLTSSAAAPPTETSITLSWTAPGDDGNSGQASEYDLRYSTSVITEQNFNSATRVNSVPAPQIAGTVEEFTVTDLTSGTTYYFAIKAADEIPNWSPMSNVVNQATETETTPPGNIVNLIASIPTQTSLTLFWAAPGDDGSSGQAAQYDIRYSTAPITNVNFDSAVQVPNNLTPKVPGSTETIQVNNLQASTMYYFAIKTADEVPNWSGLSNVAQAQTAGDQVAPAAINDLQSSTGTNNGELILNWTAPGDDGWSGTVSAYEIRYSNAPINSVNFETADLLTDPPAPLAGGQSQEYTLTGLNPGHFYYVAMRSYDDLMNQSPLSNVTSDTAGFRLGLGIDENYANLPNEYDLAQNYPNPFNPSTTISYSLPEASNVSLEIYNINGQLVNNLVNKQQSAGNYSIVWNGETSSGANLATGIYLYKISAGSYNQTKKMVYVK